ncbi:Tyrosine-protein kinase [Parasponia andersonii]|uniref:Tyrosine-protein kinase n=1 Tax=Parasponia andersonii TaxID=3476 RepID=A0A2P5BV57_PARAD|nr:Tyrosine-protein kinase [Parasponia andersonii]
MQNYTTQKPAPHSKICRQLHASLQISTREILAATNNFSSDLIFVDTPSNIGFIYKTELSNGRKLIAVKKLAPQAFQEFMEFRSELEILGKLQPQRGSDSQAYMHGLEKPTIPSDVESSNVLLDSEFEAHISDFGLARTVDSCQSHVST